MGVALFGGGRRWSAMARGEGGATRGKLTRPFAPVSAPTAASRRQTWRRERSLHLEARRQATRPALVPTGCATMPEGGQRKWRGENETFASTGRTSVHKGNEPAQRVSVPPARQTSCCTIRHSTLPVHHHETQLLPLLLRHHSDSPVVQQARHLPRPRACSFGRCRDRGERVVDDEREPRWNEGRCSGLRRIL